jgi:hypothetical protein
MASCQALSCPIAVVDSGTSPGDVKPLVLDIWWSIDRVDTSATESYMKKIIFYQGMIILCQSHHEVYACNPG